MKSKLKILPLAVILTGFMLFNSFSIKNLYDEMVNATGLVIDLEKEVTDENKKAMENEAEYRRLLEAEEGNLTEEINESAAPENDKLSLYALSALLMDASNNRVLYEENGEKRCRWPAQQK